MFFLTIRVTTSLDNVRFFVAVVHYTPENHPERQVQSARIDTSHGDTHFHRLYRPYRPKERIDVDVRETADLLADNWRTYAERFEELYRE